MPDLPQEDHSTDDDTNIYIEEDTSSGGGSSRRGTHGEDDTSSLSSSSAVPHDLLVGSGGGGGGGGQAATLTRQHDHASKPSTALPTHGAVHPIAAGAGAVPSKPSSWRRTVLLILVLTVAALGAALGLPMLLLSMAKGGNTTGAAAGVPTSSAGQNASSVPGTTEAPPPLSSSFDTTDISNATGVTTDDGSPDDAAAPGGINMTALADLTIAPIASSSRTTVAPTTMITIPSLTGTPVALAPALAVAATSPPLPAPVTSTTIMPTAKPQSPTSSPTSYLSSQLLELVRSVSAVPDQLEDTATSEGKAIHWMRTVDRFTSTTRVVQRYAVVTMVYGLNMLSDDEEDNILIPTTDECTWTGVICDTNDVVTAIRWPGRQRLGRLPADIGLLSSSLETLDLAENMVADTIPSGLYSLTELQYLYLQNNLLTGTLSSQIGNLSALRKIYLGSNSLIGSIPSELGGTTTVMDGSTTARPLEWISFCNNRFSGSIPPLSNLPNLYYLDLGNNELVGTLPIDDWVQTMGRLRTLYLDYNLLSGRLSNDLGRLGNGALEQLVLNDNLFTGEFPGRDFDALRVLEVQNNGFDRMERDVCDLSIFWEGAGDTTGTMSIFKADCAICGCQLYFCDPGRCFE